MSNLIPESWLSESILQKRIICHWTVTSYRPDDISLDSYHIVIDGDGVPHRGSGDLDDRMPHCYGFNSAIGISLACMGGYQSASNPGPYPVTEQQWESLIKIVRQLCDRYGIEITPTTVLMHGEVSKNLLVDQWGKFDIGRVDYLHIMGTENCGDELRRRVKGTNDDTLRVPVSVRVAGYNKVVNGLLMDASTLVPIREFAKATKVIEIQSVNSPAIMVNPWKTVSVKINKETAARQIPMIIIDGVGYVSLKELAQSMGWTSKVEQWNKEKRIVVVQPKEA